MARFGFQEPGLNRLEIVVAELNYASCRVAEKACAHFEDMLRNRLVLAGVPSAAALYALTPLDFRLSRP